MSYIIFILFIIYSFMTSSIPIDILNLLSMKIGDQCMLMLGVTKRIEN